ncbi:unnamed protein product [Ixodes pacificus]
MITTTTPLELTTLDLTSETTQRRCSMKPGITVPISSPRDSIISLQTATNRSPSFATSVTRQCILH